MSFSRRRFIGTSIALLAMPAVRAQQAAAPAGFPGQPIELMVAYPAGGGMDITARILAKYLESAAGHPVLVANRAGASGLIGHSWLATRAEPDGHVLGVLASNFWQDALLRSEGRWSYRDIVPIAFLNYDPIGWIVSARGPFAQADLADVIAAARKKPGTVRLAATNATSSAFILDQVSRHSGASFLPVAYQGGRQALTDLLGGHIDVSFGYLGEYRSQLDAGEIRVLAVCSAERIPALPNVPTFNETLSQKDMLWDAFRFVGAPAKTPADRLQWLSDTLRKAVADPGLAKEYAQLGTTPDPTLNEPGRLAEEYERRAGLEREFFVKTGRLK